MDPITAMMLGSGMGGSSSASSGFSGFSAGMDGSAWTVASGGGRADATNVRGPDPVSGAVAGAVGGTNFTLLALAALAAIVVVRVMRGRK